MSLADRLKQRNLEREIAGKHPLIAMGLDRGTRDAYFRGIVLAAFLDDGKVDESERAYLRRVGLGLDLPDAEVVDMISSVGELRTEDDQLALLEEISALIGKSAGVVKLFISEFSLVWRSHAANNAELETYRTEIARMIGVDIPDAFWREFDAIFNDQAAAVKTGRMLDGLDLNAMAYLFPKYAGKQMRVTNDRPIPTPRKKVADRPISTPREKVTDTTASHAPLLHAGGEYCIILKDCGSNLNTIVGLISDIPGISRAAACKIVTAGGGRLPVNLSHDEAMLRQRQLKQRGASVDVVKAYPTVTSGEYCIILKDCGSNLNTIVGLISDIPGISRSAACKIVTAGGGRLPVNLSYGEATMRQEKLKQMGASADVVKA